MRNENSQAQVFQTWGLAHEDYTWQAFKNSTQAYFSKT